MTLRDLQQKLRDLIKSSAHEIFGVELEQINTDQPPKPDVVLFGEMLPPRAFELASSKAAQCDLCFVIGTSALVYPAAGLPGIAKSAGAYVCEVNPERTPLSDLCDEVITGKAGEVVPQIGL